MDINFVIAFITGGSLVASVIMGFIKKEFDDVSARWSDAVKLIVLFLICLFISFFAWAFQFIPSNILITATEIFSGAVVLYQVVYKALIQKAIMGKTDNV